MDLTFSVDAMHQYRILFISSYSPSFETFFNQVDGMKSVLDDAGALLDIEFMDTKRFYTEENYDNFYKSLTYKLDNVDTYDAVIVGDDNALNFIVDHRELFSEQPIIFLGINDVDMALEIGALDQFTGIYEYVSIDGTINLAKKLKPSANNVVALVDSTPTAQAVKKLYYDIASSHTDLTFEDIDISSMTFEDYEIALQELNEQDIIIFVAVHRDMTGKTIDYEEGVELTFKNLDQPVFSLYDFGLDNGLVGGEVVSFVEQGKVAATIAIESLNNHDKALPKVQKNNYVKLLNYEIVKDYELNMDSLDDSILFINKPESIFIKYLPYILVGLVIIILQALTIFYLNLSVQKRKKVEVALTTSLGELESSNIQLSDAVEEIEKKKVEINELIYVDGLTKLRNRHAITELIYETLKHANEDALYAILFIDTDNFKFINDTFGHAYGDRVIIETAYRLSKFESEEVHFGRFGGDEFLVIAKGHNMETIKTTIRELLEAFNKPILMDENSFYLSISIGASIYPYYGTEQEELVKKADMALYEAKNAGKNRAVIFETELNNVLEDKVMFHSEIRKAFANRDFYVHYQPQYDIRNGNYIGAEALIRWHSDVYDYVSPFKLIGAAEEIGLIVDIGQWIMKEACVVVKKLNDRLENKIKMSINISAIQLMHSGFIEVLKKVIDETNVDPTWLTLEMTETTLFEFYDKNESVLKEITKLGVALALDDFGTGYSSLSYFRNVPASIIKIDKSFVDKIVDEEYDRFTVESIIKLAHHKALKVIAEGVEYEEQMLILKALDCDVIQGYYYSKPISEEELAKLF